MGDALTPGHGCDLCRGNTPADIDSAVCVAGGDVSGGNVGGPGIGLQSRDAAFITKEIFCGAATAAAAAASTTGCTRPQEEQD